MKLDKFIGKLTMLALLLQKYKFEVVHYAGVTNLDVDGFSRNPSPLNKDLTEARWHGNCYLGAVPGWHVATYPILFSSSTIEVLIPGLDDENDQPQTIADI